MQIAYDLSNSLIRQYVTTGFSFYGSAATGTANNYFGVCSGMNHQSMLGGNSALDFDTVVYRTYYGLPFHQWAYIKFQFVIIDQW